MRKKGGFFYAGTEIHTRVYCALTGLLRVEGKYNGASPHFVAFCLSGAVVGFVIMILCGRDGDDLFLDTLIISPLQGFYQFEENVVQRGVSPFCRFLPLRGERQVWDCVTNRSR